MEDIIQLIHKHYIQYNTDPIALLRWHLTKRSFYVDWQQLSYLSHMLENITKNNMVLYKKTVDAYCLVNIITMREIYDVYAIVDKIIKKLVTLNPTEIYYDDMFKGFVISDLLGQTPMDLQCRNTLLKVDNLLKNKYHWHIIIKNGQTQYIDDDIIKAEKFNQIWFGIYIK